MDCPEPEACKAGRGRQCHQSPVQRVRQIRFYLMQIHSHLRKVSDYLVGLLSIAGARDEFTNCIICVHPMHGHLTSLVTIASLPRIRACMIRSSFAAIQSLQLVLPS